MSQKAGGWAASIRNVLQRQLPLCIQRGRGAADALTDFRALVPATITKVLPLMALGGGPCGKRGAFSSRRPREAGFLWKGGHARFPWDFRARAGAGAWGVQGGQAVVDSVAWETRPLAASARKLVPLSSRITQWWMTRSMAAAVVMGSLNILSHWENTRFEVMTMLRRS